MTVAKAYRESTPDGSGGVTLGNVQEGSIVHVSSYDGLNRRIVKMVQNSADLDCTYHYYYDMHWRILETRNGSDQTLQQYIWAPLNSPGGGSGYTDELIQIAYNANPTDPGEQDCEATSNICQDANYNILGVLDNDGNVIERYEYTPYGQRTVFISPGYSSDPGCYAPTLLSRRMDTVGDPHQPYGLCPFGHQGLLHEEELANGSVIQNRNRVLLADYGRWAQRDPAGYIDGMGLYQYVRSNPVTGVDPTGRWKKGPGNQARREYTSECGDTLDWVVGHVGLSSDIDEVRNWLKGDSLNFADESRTSIGSLAAADLKKALKADQKVTVPNVWVAADLLRGAGLIQRTFVNPGGTIGIFVGTDIFTQGKKVVKPTTFNELDTATGGGDVWGLVIFGHGAKFGYLGDYNGIEGNNWGYQSLIIGNLHRQGYRVAHAYAMQCYSHFVGKDEFGVDQDWKTAWEDVALHAYGYQGMNVIMIDTD